MIVLNWRLLPIFIRTKGKIQRESFLFRAAASFKLQIKHELVYKLIWRLFCAHYRRSCSQMFFKITVLKNFKIFTGKHLCWSLFLIKFQSWWPATLLKRNSNTGVFCEYCKILKISSFSRTPMKVAPLITASEKQLFQKNSYIKK